MKDEKMQLELFEHKDTFNPFSKTEDALTGYGTPRLKTANRHQIEFRVGSIDQLIPDDHRVRLVWDFLQQLDLSGYLKTIKSVKGCAARPAIDPKIITAIWLYGTIQGIASACQLAELCKEHHAYIWLCGGTEIGRKTLSNFRAEQVELFNRLLAQSVGIMLHNGLISLEEVGQDGMRV
jgi:transposase